LRRHFKDEPLLALLDHIIDEGPSKLSDSNPRYFAGDDLFSPTARRVGLPIGNLTSQFFANLYLNGLDHFIKDQLRVPGYLRYVDDMILLSDSKEQLWAWLIEIERELGVLRLSLHPRKRHLCPTADGLDVLGYRVFHGHRHLRDDNAQRFARKMRGMARAYAMGRYELADFRPSICSWLGHARHANTAALQNKIFGDTIFTRDSTLSWPARAARRFVEQQR
jgi:RNA-directed DNA polymerase